MYFVDARSAAASPSQPHRYFGTGAHTFSSASEDDEPLGLHPLEGGFDGRQHPAFPRRVLSSCQGRTPLRPRSPRSRGTRRVGNQPYATLLPRGRHRSLPFRSDDCRPCQIPHPHAHMVFRSADSRRIWCRIGNFPFGFRSLVAFDRVQSL